MSNPQPLHIAAVAHDLPGQNVVLADGDELGVITDVIQTSAVTNGVPAHSLVIDLHETTTDTPSDQLCISGESILAVTDDAVVLGTTARWLDQHTVTEPERGSANQPAR